MIHSPIVISGVPACGKTSFGDWLRDNRSFKHLDMEATAQHDQTRQLWTYFASGQRAKVEEALQKLRAGFERLVVTWGFVPNETGLGILSTFRDQGYELWWFTGPIDKAREEWVRRDNRPDSQLFDGQMANIGRAKHALNSLYAETTIQTLEADGSRMPSEAIEARIISYQTQRHGQES
ncbi:MAG: hypothetical protein JNM99_04220 [Verrucomicrobiaceae bacterium]|nr:hypothetical protein [Verrucomicrobiaceae bacterium]